MTSFNTECIEENIGDVIQGKTIFEWSIRNFSNYCKNVGDVIVSPLFSHGSNKEFSWRFLLYPYGRDDKSNGFLSLYLRKKSHSVKTSFVLSIIYMDIKIEHTFTPEEFSFGVAKFMNRNAVIENMKHSDDVFTIVCKIHSADDVINNFSSSQNCNVKLKALDDIGQLYINKNLSDLILRVGSKEFHVHKAILSARSEVFAAMFKHDMIENSKNFVEIEDINCGIMDAMLKFMYTGEVENIQDTVKELLIAADRYVIKDLKDICIIELGQFMNVDNAIDLLLFAEHYNFDEFKTTIMDFIVNNAKEIVGKPGFESIRNAPSEIIIDLFSKLASVPKS